MRDGLDLYILKCMICAIKAITISFQDFALYTSVHVESKILPRPDIFLLMSQTVTVGYKFYYS